MKLDNKSRAGRIKLFYMLIPFLIVTSAALIYLVGDSKDFIWAVLGGVTLLVFFVLMFVFKFYYIIFYAGPDKVQLKYKSMSPFPSQNSSVQIKSEQFHDYKITHSLLGIKKNIVLFLNTPGGVAAFPKISISALKKEEIDKIAKALDLIKQLNKSKTD